MQFWRLWFTSSQRRGLLAACKGIILSLLLEFLNSFLLFIISIFPRSQGGKDNACNPPKQQRPRKSKKLGLNSYLHQLFREQPPPSENRTLQEQQLKLASAKKIARRIGDDLIVEEVPAAAECHMKAPESWYCMKHRVSKYVELKNAIVKREYFVTTQDMQTRWMRTSFETMWILFGSCLTCTSEGM